MGYVMRGILRLTAFLRGLTRERRSFAVEAYLAVQAVMFGTWLLAPWDTFDTLPVAYDALSFVPEVVWGVLFTGHGILNLIALDQGDMMMRRRGTSFTVLLWLMMLCGFLVAAPLSSATPMYLMPVLAGIWAHNVHTNAMSERRSEGGGES